MNNKFTLLVLGFLFFLLLRSSAQDCATTLRRAERLYEEGKIEEIQEILASCIKKGFTPEERQQAYKLIILTYLFEDNQQEAEANMLKFLKKYPEYEILPSDPAEFTYLFQTFKTTPIFTVGGIVGGNFSGIRVIEPYSISTLSSSGKYSSSGMAMHFGIKVNKKVWKDVALDLEILMKTRKFRFESTFATFTDPEEIFSELTFKENQTLLEIPLIVTYNYIFDKFRFYGGIGGYTSFLLSSSAQVNRVYVDESRLPDVTGPDIPLDDHRNFINYGAILNGGAKYKLKKSYVFFDIRYNFGLSNMVNPDNRTTNTELNQTYFYIDDDFSINNLSFSIGFMKSFYNSVKIKTK